jgi:VWFA-related protein
MTHANSSRFAFWRRQVVALVALASTVLAIGWVTADDQVARPSAAFFMPVDVPLVNVEVVVTDRKGVPIPGLTEADFEVLEDGEPVEVSHFFASLPPPEQPDGGGAVSTVPAVPHQELYLALYIDDLDTDARQRAAALAHLREFLDQPLPPNVKSMLVRFDGALHIESDFSDNTDQLLAALDKIRDYPSMSAARDEQALFRQMQAATTDQRGQIREEMDSSPGPIGGGDATVPRPPAFNEPDNRPDDHNFLPQIHAVARTQHLRSRASLEALEQFVGYLHGVPGRKAVLWVGGLDTRPGENLFLAYQELFPGDARRKGVNPMMEATQYDITLDLQELLEFANSQRVSFYTLSSLGSGLEQIASTETRGRDASRRSGFTDIWGEEDALDMMSESTGGRTLADNRNLDQQLAQVSTELGSYYSLGYTPPSPGDGEYHKITVNVRREGTRVRHRQGYRNTGERDRMTDRTLAAVTLGIADNPLGIALEAQPQEPRSEGTFLVPVMIRIPIGDLVLMPEADYHAAQISVFSVVRDDDGRLSDVHDRVYPIEIANDRLLSAVAQQAGFVLGMVLREGPHRIAISVRDNNSMLESTAYVDVVVGTDLEGQSG